MGNSWSGEQVVQLELQTLLRVSVNEWEGGVAINWAQCRDEVQLAARSPAPVTG